MLNARSCAAIVALVLLASVAPSHAGTNPIFVDDDAPAGGDGASWGTAYCFLQDALTAAAMALPPVEIRVGQGTYRPDQSEATPGESGDRNATFGLFSQLTITGGFAGLGAPNQNALDGRLYPTILSGDLAGNDAYVVPSSECEWVMPDLPGNEENSFAVCEAVGPFSEIELRGLEIRSGRREGGSGGAGGLMVFLTNPDGPPGSLVLRGCRFIGNTNANSAGSHSAASLGAVAYIEDCEFIGNVGDFSAVRAETNSYVTFVRCRFAQNWTETTGQAVYTSARETRFLNCEFVGNSARALQMRSIFDGEHELVNCIVRCNGNASEAVFIKDFPATMTNCTIVDNGGDGVMVSDTFLTASNCIVRGHGVSVVEATPGAATITHSNIEGGWTGAGGNNIDADPLFVDPGCGDYRLKPFSPSRDAGDNAAVPADDLDLDGDGNPFEPIPFDVLGNPRFVDDADVVDTGAGGPPTVDIGAFEAQSDSGLPGPAVVLYVDDDAPMGGDGCSWATAFRFLQDGLAAAAGQGGAVELRVAQGTYTSDRSEAVPAGTGDQAATFEIPGDTTLLGGFAGHGAGEPDARDSMLFPTILSGDLNGNDVMIIPAPGCADEDPVLINYEDNSNLVCRVMTSPINVTIRGCTISGGHDDGGVGGGGLRAQSALQLTINECRFIGNRAVNGSGLTVNGTSQVEVLDCAFIGNVAADFGGGAAIFGLSTTAAFRRCEFRHNVATARNSRGGAIRFVRLGLVEDCVFTANRAGGGAALITVTDSSELRIVNSVFRCNRSPLETIWLEGDLNALVNCTIVGNLANGVRNFGQALDISNCIIRDNVLEIVEQPGAETTVSHSNIDGGWSGNGGNNIDADPLFVDVAGGDYRLGLFSPCRDAGDNAALPADEFDLDGDGNTTEPIPFDLAGRPRRVDDPAVVDAGSGAAPIVDIGAHEAQQSSDPLDLGPPLDFPIDGEATIEVIADITGDGFPDLVIAIPEQIAIQVFVNLGVNPAGEWEGFDVGEPILLDAAPVDIALGFIDGDALLDAVVLTDDGMVSLLLGTGMPADPFSMPADIAGIDVIGPTAIATADVDGDGDADLIIATDSPSGLLFILRNNGDGTFTLVIPPPDSGDGPILDVDPECWDDDKDMVVDLATANESENLVSILPGAGSGFFDPPSTFPVGASPVDLGSGDFDGDGDRDIASANSGSASISILLANGGLDYGPAESVLVGENPVFVEGVDLTGDGVADLAVIANGDTGPELQVLESLCVAGIVAFGPLQTVVIVDEPNAVLGADLNADGAMDLVTVNDAPAVSGAGSVVVILNDRDCPGDINGDGTVDGLDVAIVEEHLGCVGPACLGDADGDGDTDADDLALVNARFGDCPLGAAIFCPGDTDGNGDVDIDDMVSVILDFGTEGNDHGGDVDGSGLVDIDDVIFVVLQFGQPCLGAGVGPM